MYAQKKLSRVLASHRSGNPSPLDASWCVIIRICAIRGGLDTLTPGYISHVLACRDHQANGTDSGHNTQGHAEWRGVPGPMTCQHMVQFLL